MTTTAVANTDTGTAPADPMVALNMAGAGSTHPNTNGLTTTPTEAPHFTAPSTTVATDQMVGADPVTNATATTHDLARTTATPTAGDSHHLVHKPVDTAGHPAPTHTTSHTGSAGTTMHVATPEKFSLKALTDKLEAHAKTSGHSTVSPIDLISALLGVPDIANNLTAHKIDVPKLLSTLALEATQSALAPHASTAHVNLQATMNKLKLTENYTGSICAKDAFKQVVHAMEADSISPESLKIAGVSGTLLTTSIVKSPMDHANTHHTGAGLTH
jgi:hypothetical protein